MSPAAWALNRLCPGGDKLPVLLLRLEQRGACLTKTQFFWSGWGSRISGICPSLQELMGCRGRGVGCRGLGRVQLMFPALCGSHAQTHCAMPPGPSSHSQGSRWRPVDWENWDSPMRTTHSSLWNLRMAPPFFGPRNKAQRWWLGTPAGTWLVSDLLTHEVAQQMAASYKGGSFVILCGCTRHRPLDGDCVARQ